MADASKYSDSSSVVSSEVEVVTAFQAPIFKLLVNDAELTKQLRTTILDRYPGKPGVGSSERLQNSSRGGWQSHHDLHEWSSPGIDRLLQRIQGFAHEVVHTTVENPKPAHFEDWLVEAWGNVNVKGARNAPTIITASRAGRYSRAFTTSILDVSPERTPLKVELCLRIRLGCPERRLTMMIRFPMS